MPDLTIHLSDEEYDKLLIAARHQRRDPESQAEVFVLDALGMPLKPIPRSPARPRPVTPKLATTGTGEG